MYVILIQREIDGHLIRKENTMGYDFERDLQNDAAKKNYDAAMNGETRKGVDYFEKPHLWDEERPCDLKDTPTDNFIPTPTISSGGEFASYSLGKKIAIIAAFAVIGILVAVCAITFFMDGGGKLQPPIGGSW